VITVRGIPLPTGLAQGRQPAFSRGRPAIQAPRHPAARHVAVNDSTACEMRSASRLRGSGSRAPAATRTRPRLPRTPGLALCASLAGSERPFRPGGPVPRVPCKLETASARTGKRPRDRISRLESTLRTGARARVGMTPPLRPPETAAAAGVWCAAAPGPTDRWPSVRPTAAGAPPATGSTSSVSASPKTSVPLCLALLPFGGPGDRALWSQLFGMAG